MQKLVSVVIPTYNRLKYLTECINSITAQTYENLEIIVIDDNSEDGTETYIKNKSDSRIKYFNFGKINNIGRLRNLGIKNSSGEIICFCDDDDIWQPDKMEKQLKLIPEYSVICSNASVIDANGEILKKEILGFNSKQIFEFKDFVLFNPVITSTLMAKKEVFTDTGYFNEEQKFFASEDYELWIRISKTFKFYYIKEKLIKYRFHESSSHNIPKRIKMLNAVKDLLTNYYKTEKEFIIKKNSLTAIYNLHKELLRIYLKKNDLLNILFESLCVVSVFFKKLSFVFKSRRSLLLKS
ncbi:MAG: glycosyltransferase [Bacteroidetes bacterium]|nr:glycosyltransferase [Bacteroidota bacterium]